MAGSGGVWFLAGIYGTRRTIRACKVPAGKHLFFPLINYVVYPRPGAVPPPNCMSVMTPACHLPLQTFEWLTTVSRSAA